MKRPTLIPSLDQLREEEHARHKAFEQLETIWATYPDLFTRFAKACLPNGTDFPKLAPTTAIMEWLKAHQKGTAGEMLKDLAMRVKTSSARPQSAIYSTLASLAKRNKIAVTKNDDGENTYSYVIPGDQ